MFDFDLVSFIKAVGYLGIFGIIFAETGLLVGFFLPGDSLLFTAGFLASSGWLNIWVLIVLSFIAAVVGYQTGFWFGQKVGPRIFSRKDSRFFHQDNIKKAQEFYRQHGPLTIILARFVPIVRTFVPIIAGVGKMETVTFTLYNLISAALWTVSLPLLGYYLGRVIPGVDKYILPIVGVIIVVSLLPSVITVLRAKA